MKEGGKQRCGEDRYRKLEGARTKWGPRAEETTRAVERTMMMIVKIKDGTAIIESNKF